MTSTETFAQYANQMKTTGERLASALRTTGQNFMESGQEIHLCAAGQVQSHGRRLLSTLEDMAGSADAAGASKICADFLTESSRVQAEHLAEWSRIFFRACSRNFEPALDAFRAQQQTA